MSRRLTTEEFIANARKVHGDRYDYSLVTYRKATEKVPVICKEHGVFHVTPNNHTSGKGSGCPVCGGSMRWTNDTFIAKARSVHGDIYDYSLVKYVNSRSHVAIRCKAHDEIFQQAPAVHLAGAGCPRCSVTYSPTTAEFIERCRSVHGETYDYSECRYTTTKAKVKIICKAHGPFMQSAGKHIGGQGCPKCPHVLNVKLSVDEILARCMETHNGRYSYSRSSVTNTSSKMEITCARHGHFWQTPEEHYNGAGCPLCAANAPWELNELLLKFRETHGDKYDYSRVRYSSTKSKVEIVCKEHGSFFQTPDNHMYGCGCPKCSTTGFKPYRRGCLYLYSIATSLGEELLGFGITNSIHHRDRQHQAEFRKSNARGHLIHKFFFNVGEYARRLEAEIAKSFPIINSGIYGFMKESILVENLPTVLEMVIPYHSNFKNAA